LIYDLIRNFNETIRISLFADRLAGAGNSGGAGQNRNINAMIDGREWNGDYPLLGLRKLFARIAD
jgi:hypothetical protein